MSSSSPLPAPKPSQARDRLFWRVLSKDSNHPIWLPVLSTTESQETFRERFKALYPHVRISLIEKRSVFGGPLVPESSRRFN